MLLEELGALLQELLTRDVAVAVIHAVPREIPAAPPGVASLFVQ